MTFGSRLTGLFRRLLHRGAVRLCAI